jgi:BMFP domain-containing protein YqiC
MFGKKEGFKYEVEVKALIREATEGLNQRIAVLETQNQQLIQELNQLKNGLCNDFQRLERRITDFTDVWHPFMIQNINRIKEDLEKTIIEAEREDIKKVQADLECKMMKMIEDNRTNLAKNSILGLSSYTNCTIKLSDIKRHFDSKLNDFEIENKTKFNPKIHGVGKFSFDIGLVYHHGVNIIVDSNSIIINGSNKKIINPNDMLDEIGWKMFLSAMPFVGLRINGMSKFDPNRTKYATHGAVCSMNFNEYVLSPSPLIYN